MLLPAVMRFSMAGAVDRYADLGVALGATRGRTSTRARAASAIDGVAELCADLGIPSLGGHGIERGDFERQLPKLANDAIESGSPANTPVVPSAEQIMNLYLAAY
jgi:alcohol dehydrogenase